MEFGDAELTMQANALISGDTGASASSNQPASVIDELTNGLIQDMVNAITAEPPPELQRRAVTHTFAVNYIITLISILQSEPSRQAWVEQQIQNTLEASRVLRARHGIVRPKQQPPAVIPPISLNEITGIAATAMGSRASGNTPIVKEAPPVYKSPPPSVPNIETLTAELNDLMIAGEFHPVNVQRTLQSNGFGKVPAVKTASPPKAMRSPGMQRDAPPPRTNREVKAVPQQYNVVEAKPKPEAKKAPPPQQLPAEITGTPQERRMPIQEIPPPRIMVGDIQPPPAKKASPSQPAESEPVTEIQPKQAKAPPSVLTATEAQTTNVQNQQPPVRTPPNHPPKVPENIISIVAKPGSTAIIPKDATSNLQIREAGPPPQPKAANANG